MTSSFKSAPADKSELENGSDLTPRFDANGLITAVVVDSGDNEVLMLAHMNDEALRLTIETGLAHYWSRSRNQLWKKGETSGNMQTVDEIRIDCDQDAVLLKVRVSGADATCHTGRRSCFYRKVVERDGQIRLEIGSEPLFDPASVYTDH
ncbi:MAG: phosphoribosyl-AMP cyclohydrolase [Hoeflea sp.]|uniref:phosphoribosyl-AMP cyclohydrolase n=1 Tax=Hoeflea sp. TaxID=1940281 RepID=UPI000C0E8045|nr:phosphoribosyl-AMP cyclohydrolase [Hoeflea sp.]PHR24958.1 MAG: phosphoribosyl-AMP cyclohydrolase [Hoeflea sp.]